MDLIASGRLRWPSRSIENQNRAAFQRYPVVSFDGAGPYALSKNPLTIGFGLVEVSLANG